MARPAAPKKRALEKRAPERLEITAHGNDQYVVVADAKHRVSLTARRWYGPLFDECRKALERSGNRQPWIVEQSEVEPGLRRRGYGVDIYAAATHAVAAYGGALVASDCVVTMDEPIPEEVGYTSPQADRVWDSRRLAERVRVDGHVAWATAENPAPYEYAPMLRPISFATVPKGSSGTRSDPRYRFGVVQYDAPLPRSDLEHYDLVALDPDDPINHRRAFDAFHQVLLDRFSAADIYVVSDERGARTVLTWSTRPHVQWQVTYFDVDIPTGHDDVDDFDRATMLMWGGISTETRRKMSADLIPVHNRISRAENPQDIDAAFARIAAHPWVTAHCARTGCRSLTEGGCLAFARAVQQWLGAGDLVVLLAGPVPFHVAVELDDDVYDAEGLTTRTELLRRWTPRIRDCVGDVEISMAPWRDVARHAAIMPWPGLQRSILDLLHAELGPPPTTPSANPRRRARFHTDTSETPVEDTYAGLDPGERPRVAWKTSTHTLYLVHESRAEHERAGCRPISWWSLRDVDLRDENGRPSEVIGFHTRRKVLRWLALHHPEGGWVHVDVSPNPKGPHTSIPPTVSLVRPATPDEVTWAKYFEQHTSSDDFDIYDWYVGWVATKQFLARKLHTGEPGMASRRAWQTWWDGEIGEQGARPGSEGLMEHFEASPLWEIDDEMPIVTFKGKLHNIEDGWHRTAVAVLRGFPRLPAMIGIQRTPNNPANRDMRTEALSW